MKNVHNILPENARAIAFDFDGTLADTMSVHKASRLAAFKEMTLITGDDRYANVPQSVHEAAHAYGTVSQEIIGWILMHMGIIQNMDNPALTQLVEIKKKQHHSMKLPMTLGARRVLKYARKRFGNAVGIVTTAHRIEVENFLKENSLEGYVPPNLIVTIDDVGVPKPAPDMYAEFLDRSYALPSEAIAVEDARKGIESARRAGMFTIGIATTHTLDELSCLSDYQRPDYIAADLVEVCNFLAT